MSWASQTLVVLCRWSYYVSLLGLKIPLGLLVNASRAPIVLTFITFAWTPFSIYCHLALLPNVQSASTYGLYVWQVLLSMWVTIPLLVVGFVILSVARSTKLLGIFSMALVGVACLHWLVVPTVWSTWTGTVLLHTLFLLFEDVPIAAWVWALVHVVRMQRHVAARQVVRESPFKASQDLEQKVLIVGNAPTVTEGPALGAVIDSFHQVVRFNQYSVDKAEYTGSKVGFHFCNGRNFPSSHLVTAVCPLFYASLTHAVYLFMPHLEDAQDIYNDLTSAKVDSWFIGEEHILALRKKIGCALWQIPTSGMCALDAFLAQRKEVVLHGFNFFEGKKIHYFEESPTQLITSWLERFVTHDPSLEQRWVHSLEREGRVTFLAQRHAVATGAAEDAVMESDEVPSEIMLAAAEKERKLEGDNDPRRRPGLLKTLLRDGLPSQFSI
jgi:hypothetical protein